MPFINVFTSVAPLAAERRTALLRSLSETLARELGKPESYVMTCLTPQASMTFGGSDAPACYAEVKNIGAFTPDRTARLSGVLCALLASELGVAKNRIYIEFSSPEPHSFGFNGETFA
jgi:phenylpyruvate tautomerase